VVHDTHDGVLVPPWGILDALDFTTHDNNLASGDELAASVGRPEVVGHTGRSDIAIESLGQTVDELGALAGAQDVGRGGGENKVAVQVHHERIRRSVKQGTALSGDTKDVRTGLLDEVLDVTGVDDGNVQAAPFVHPYAVPDRLSGNGKNGGIVTDENDTTGRRHSGLDNTDNVRDGQAGKERPHGEVLEAGGRRRELVAKGVILHIDTDKVIESRGGEAQDARDFLGVEQVRSLVPVNPHTPEVVTQQVIQGIPGEETQTVGNPVGLVGIVVEIRLRLLSQFPDGLGSLFVSARPDSQSDTVESVGGILLEYKGMVNAVRLALAGANLDIVREACLFFRQ